MQPWIARTWEAKKKTFLFPALSFAISVMVSLAISHVQNRVRRSEFQTLAGNRALIVMQHLETNAKLLKALQGFTQGLPAATWSSLNRFVANFSQPTKAIVRFYWWAPARSSTAAKALQAYAEEPEGADRRIDEISELLGTARATNRPAAKIIGTGTPVCLVGLPVQRSSSETGGEGVLMAFRVGEMIDDALAPLAQARMNFTVYGSSGEILYSRNSGQASWYAFLTKPFQPSPQVWRQEWPIQVADQHWRLAVSPVEGYYGLAEVLMRVVWLPVAFLFSVLLFRFFGAAEKSLRRSEDRLLKAYAEAAVGMIICDETGRILIVNPAICELSGYGEPELVGTSILGMIAPEFREAARKQMDNIVSGAVPSYQVEQRIARKNGVPRWLRLSMSGFEGNEIQTSLAILCEDISEQMLARETLVHQATHDLLTGLPNRRVFEANVTAAIDKARTACRPMALAYIDIDGFKVVNDSLGHAAGDHLLVEIAQRLSTFAPPGAMLAHVGGDEFTVVLEEADDQDAVIATVDRMIHALENPFVFDRQELSISASAGISSYPWDGSDSNLLMQHADWALYHAKRTGKRRCCVLTQEMRDDAAARLELERNLRRAVERGEIEVHFQPILDRRGEVVVRFEALCRWSYPSLGYVSPARFIPIAEETGLIIPLGDYVLITACRQAKLWNRRRGSLPIQVAVNISPVQFNRADFVGKVARILDETGLNPNLLELELTESLSLGDVEAAIRKMRQLRALGISVAMDDFGAGYSSLNYLRRLPIDTLKIDRAFVNDIGCDSTSKNFVGSVISLAHGLGLKVVGEGVETVKQFDTLNSLMCDELQGFLLGKPVHSELAMALVNVG